MRLTNEDVIEIEKVLAWLRGPTFTKPWIPLAYLPFLSRGNIHLAVLAQREGDDRYYTIRAYSTHTEIEIEDRVDTLAKGLARLPEAAAGQEHVFDLIRL